MIIAALIGSIEDGNIHCELENETEYQKIRIFDLIKNLLVDVNEIFIQ